MKNINRKNNTQKQEIPSKVKKGFRFYAAAVLSLALVMGMSVTAFAAGDPITVVNNLSDFIFGLIQTITGYAAWVFARQEDFAAQQVAYHHVGENPRRLVVWALRHASLAHAHCPDCRRSERL